VRWGPSVVLDLNGEVIEAKGEGGGKVKKGPGRSIVRVHQSGLGGTYQQRGLPLKLGEKGPGRVQFWGRECPNTREIYSPRFVVVRKERKGKENMFQRTDR